MKEYIVDTDDFDSHDALVGYIKYNYEELIRCKECRHYDSEHEVCCVYVSYRFTKNADDYCSDAERKGD